MERVIKTFCKVVTLTAHQTSSVVLHDTNGNILPCNWIKVAVDENPATDGYINVQPSSNTTGVTLYTDTTVAASAATTSGAPGFLITAGDSQEVDFAQSQQAAGVDLKSAFAVTVDVLITYGVKLPFNPHRAKNLAQGS